MDRTVGLYGDEVPGCDTVADIVKYFTAKGLKVTNISGDIDYGWEMDVTGKPWNLFYAVTEKIPGYNKQKYNSSDDAVKDFIDEYSIDDLDESANVKQVVNKILEGADVRKALSEGNTDKYDLMNIVIKKIVDMDVDAFVLNFVDTDDKEKLASDIDSGFLPFNIKGKDMELSLKDGRLEYDGTSMGGNREFYFKIKEIEKVLNSIIDEDEEETDN